MKIDIAQAVRNEGEVYTEVYDGPIQSIDFMGGHFKIPKAHVEAEYSFDGEGIAVGGVFSAITMVECSRCLKEFEYQINFEFSEYYEKQPQEEATYKYTADLIELDRMLQDNIVMILPMRFLCREDCKGLCPVCGHDLNQGKCGCSLKTEESPLNELSKLYDDREV